MKFLIAIVVFVFCTPHISWANQCLPSSGDTLQKTMPHIKTNFVTGELMQLCDLHIQIAKQKISDLSSSSSGIQSFESTFGEFDQILADYNDQFHPILILQLESPDPLIRADALLCREKSNAFESEIYQSSPLYILLKNQVAQTQAEKRLYSKVIGKFEKNGLSLNPTDALQLNGSLLKIQNLLAEFETVLPESNVDKSVKIFEATLAERRKASSLLGSNNWAEYKISHKLPKSKDVVDRFLNKIQQKVSQLSPSAPIILDQSKVSEYFPADYVVPAILDLYAEIFSLKFFEVKIANTWHPSVKVYEVQNADDCRLIGYIYLDMFDRDDKMPVGMTISIVEGRKLKDGLRSYPAALFTEVFKRPESGKPQLLSHDNVRIVFHELGHVMHHVLSEVPYMHLSGTNVDEDFVEVPPTFLENFSWDPHVLQRISSHYLRSSEKLPLDLANLLIAERKADRISYYLGQLVYAKFDLDVHATATSIDTKLVLTDIYKNIFLKIPSSPLNLEYFYYPMLLDAGVYKYLWSEAYSDDFLSVFDEKNLLNAKNFEQGKKFRKVILELGDTKDPVELMKEFLGREPSFETFFNKIK